MHNAYSCYACSYRPIYICPYTFAFDVDMVHFLIDPKYARWSDLVVHWRRDDSIRFIFLCENEYFK